MNRVLKTFLSVTAYWLIASAAYGASGDSSLQKAKREAEAKGFAFETNRDEILAKAKTESSLRALLGFDPPTIKALREGFGKKYPFINTQFEEIAGTEAPQRYLLELKAGGGTHWDISHLTGELHHEYVPYLAKLDLLGMSEHRVLQVHPKMISPESRNAIAFSSTVDGIAYNKRLLPSDKLPKSWDDFLKPEYNGRKFLADVKPNSVAGLVPAMGLESVEAYARKLAAQQPIWVRGHTRYLNAMASGEYGLFLGVYYHGVMRLKGRGAQDLEFLLLEPTPVRLTETHGITRGARNPHSAMLFFEYVAGPEGQKILFDIEPFKSSVYSTGSKIEDLVRGKKTSVIEWNHLPKQHTYMERILAAYGLPREEKR